jgi:uncharacterized membrane protein
VVIGLLVLLLIPVVVMLGVMIFSAGMMAQMGGMMSGGLMALCVVWAILVAAALVFLVVSLTRGSGKPDRNKISSGEARSPLPH